MRLNETLKYQHIQRIDSDEIYCKSQDERKRYSFSFLKPNGIMGNLCYYLNYGARVYFSVCFDKADNFKKFRYMWSNQDDCCCAKGMIESFNKTDRDVG